MVALFSSRSILVRWGRWSMGNRLGILFVLFAPLSNGWAQVFGESELLPSGPSNAASRIESLIRMAVSEGGGDFDQEHVHFVFGFSTGHFDAEPMRAQAARQTAMELVDSIGIRGDRISAFAFEMEVWEHPGAEQNPLLLTSDLGPEKRIAQELFPLTIRSGSQGGHDTELSIAQIAKRVSFDTSAVIVLFTNRAASITTDPLARPLVGENDPSYLRVLEDFRRLEPVNRSGASYEATFDVKRADGDLVVNTLDIVILAPREFSSSPIEAGPRSLRLAPAVTSTIEDGGPNAAPLIAVLALIAVAATGFFIVKARAASNMVLGINEFVTPLSGFRNGEVVATLVGPDFPRDEVTDRTRFVRGNDLPPGVLATLVFMNGNVLVRNGDLDLVDVDGVPASAPMPLPRDRQMTVTLRGSHAPRVGMPPKTVSVELLLRVGRPE